MQAVLDFFLNLDEHVQNLIREYGTQVYLIFFLIIFAETGLVIMPFLPGDSLLFAIGMFCGPKADNLNVWLVIPLLASAAFIGDNLNYQIGLRFGARIMDKGGSRFFKAHYVEKTHTFFEKHGGIALVLARWVPIVRTFAPFVAGMGAMKFHAFLAWSALGAAIWVGGCTLAGYFFGRIPWVKANFEYAMLGIVVLSILPIALKLRKARA